MTTLGGPRAVIVLRMRPVLLGFIVGLLLTWAFVSLASLPPLNGPLPATEAAGAAGVLAIAGVVSSAFAAFRSFRFYSSVAGSSSWLSPWRWCCSARRCSRLPSAATGS